MHKRFIGYILCVLLLSVMGILFLQQHGMQKKYPQTQQTNRIQQAHALQKNSVLGVMNKVVLKSYTSALGKYSLSYPSDWLESENEALDTDPNITVPFFTVGPVSKTVTGFPSYIQIMVDDNKEGRSLDDYLSAKYDRSQLTFTPMTIAGQQGQETTNIQTNVPSDTIFFLYNGKVYRIRLYKGAAHQISDTQFLQVLQTMKLQ